MTYAVFDPHFQVVDANGAPVSGAKAIFYITGTTTETDVYQDSGLTTPHANPVVADASGRFAPIYTSPSVTYKMVLTDSADVTIQTVDPITQSTVLGPSSATDNAIARFDGTTGKLIQNSSVTADDSGNLSTSGAISGGSLAMPETNELTIASDVVTVTGSFHSIDTESDAVTDDLDTINGGTDGQLLIIRANNDARTVVAKDGTGNLRLAGDFSLDNTTDTLTLIYHNSAAVWYEISRSDNGS